MHVIWFAMQGKTSPTAAGAKAETCHICGNWQVRLERVIIVFMPFPSPPPFSLIFHNDFIHIIFTAFRREIVPASYRFTQERTTRVPMLATVKLVSKTNKNIKHYKELSTLKM